ncbi:prepilin-type N-terminal cleavage/methylation domain-containing protein [Enterovibrio calviensis]|uniref:prepilin-type N-terminal cleavage/methylation domain-containing protein n=1 Tax=Enterovibrio calviensis TaxID=91359 RepID=UPI0004829267|nr:prepilin-type N-terminal cleavage/methylation domain-containing protein [Enterovibrio calviensis]
MRGFTLIELLIVLVLVTLIGGIAAPSLISAAEKLAQRSEVDVLQQQVNALPAQALMEKSAIVVGRGDNAIDLGEGYRLTANTNIVYQSNGVCLGGNAVITQEGQVAFNVSLVPPFCQWKGTP